MSFQVDRGLFKVDFFDHHAILGVPIDAEVKDIRKRYLQIARILHPDSLRNASDEEKSKANEFLSKLVNPAYKKLSEDKERAEYDAMLRLMGQKASRQGGLDDLGEPAQLLLKASDYEAPYKSALEPLSGELYQSMDTALETIGQISELNLAYLVRKHGKGGSSKSTTKSTTSSSSTSSSSSSTTASSTVSGFTQRVSAADQCYKRAEGYLKAENQAKAILELRDALKLEPNNAKCHSLLGTIYMGQNQGTMAKIHFNKALESDPNNEDALKGKKKLEQPAGKPKASKDKGGGGLFGLFGGKKK